MFKACCDMTRYYLSHFFHVLVLSEWTNLMQAFLSFFFVLKCTFYNIFGTLTKCAEICFNRIYLILLYAFKVMYSKISLVNHTDICFIFPDSMIIYICSFTKKWNSLFHRGWYNCFMTCYRLVLTQKYFKGFRLTNNIFK